jgi:hypothetical protein
MPSAYQTRLIEADPQAMWNIISDLIRYADWLVLPSGKVTKVEVTRDAGVLTRSARRLEVESGRWFDEEIYEAAAPSYVAYRVLSDSSGKFARAFKSMSISIRLVPAAAGGVNVTLGVDYAKAGFIGRLTDWFGPRNWRRAFQRSLANLDRVVRSSPAPELYMPPWRAKPSPAPSPAPPVEKETLAPTLEVVPAAVEEETSTPGPSPQELQAQLTRLRALLEQSREMGLSTAEIEARIADLEAKLDT